MAVVFNWALYSVNEHSADLAMKESALSVSAPFSDIMPIISYQAPTKALPNSGWAFSLPVLTIIRSRISPGMSADVNILETPGVCSISITMGFQVTTTFWDLLDTKIGPISLSEVLTSLTSFSFKPFISKQRATR